MNFRSFPKWLSICVMIIAGCNRVTSPSNKEATDAIREALTERAVKNVPTIMQLSQEFDTQKTATAEANVKASWATLTIDITEIGSKGIADLQAPGSKDSYWPAHIKVNAPDGTLTGTMLLYMDNFHKWKAKANEEDLKWSPNAATAAAGNISDPRMNEDLQRAKQIYTACKLYAMDFSGNFPKRLDELIPDYLGSRDFLTSPLSPRMGTVDYDYSGGGLTDIEQDVQKIMVRGHYTTSDGRRSVVRVTGIGAIERQ